MLYEVITHGFAYPNPCSSIVRFNEIDAVSVKVFAINGKTVLSAKVYDNAIDVSSLDRGVYVIQVADRDGVLHSDRLMKR